MLMKIDIEKFWVMEPCNLLGEYKHSRRICCLQLQVSTLKLETAGSSETMVFTYQTKTWYYNTAYHSMGLLYIYISSDPPPLSIYIYLLQPNFLLH
jgi:hypothetical protein